MFDDISKVLLVTDLDGTLLPSSKILSQIDLNAINQFIEAGGNFSIATGRPYQSVVNYFFELQFNSPIIIYNGSMIYDKQKSKIVWQKHLPLETRQIVKEVLEEFSFVSAEILTFNGIYNLQKNETEEYHISITKTYPKECSLDEIPDEWLKVLFAVEPDLMPELISFIKKRNYKNVEFVQSCRHFYELLPKNISKGTALKELRRLYNYKDYTIVAVGDYNNDIEMIKYADIGIATGNAISEVKNVSDIVLKETCNENAKSKVIEYIFAQINTASKIIL